MMTLSSQLLEEFHYEERGIAYGLRAVQLPQDFPLLYKWMHEPHVIPQWQLNKPELELAVYFENSAASKIVGEPDENVKSYAYIAKDIAYQAQKKIKMLEKTAVLYHCYRNEFYSLCGLYQQTQE